MRVMTPKELAESWEITEMEVMDKIVANQLPEAFMVRKYPESYSIIVPKGYKFIPVKKTRRAAAHK